MYIYTNTLTHTHTATHALTFEASQSNRRLIQSYSMSWSGEEISGREVSEFQNSPTWNSNRLQKDCIYTDPQDCWSHVVDGCFLLLMVG